MQNHTETTAFSPSFCTHRERMRRSHSWRSGKHLESKCSRLTAHSLNTDTLKHLHRILSSCVISVKLLLSDQSCSTERSSSESFVLLIKSSVILYPVEYNQSITLSYIVNRLFLLFSINKKNSKQQNRFISDQRPLMFQHF